MDSKKSLLTIFHYSVNATTGITGLVSGYMIIMAFLALIGLLPKNMDASFEVPIYLENLPTNYPIEDLHPSFYNVGIELIGADLEIRPKNRTWPQTLGYLQGGLYVGFFFMIFYFLSKIIGEFRNDRPFSISNIKHFKWMGWLAISLAFYRYILGHLIAGIFADKFIVKNAVIIDGPSIWEINFIALFLGAVFLIISEVFKRGNYLQELEEQTV